VVKKAGIASRKATHHTVESFLEASMKVVTVVGARPQFIKAAVVSRAIALHNETQAKTAITEMLVHTGQHYDESMSGIFFRDLHIAQPDFHLGVAEALHGRMTGRMLAGIEEILLAERPDTVLVYGDTNSTLAGALAAAKLHIPVAHVEAGLRSFNMRMPEEINRMLTDRISTQLFCPTVTALDNLRREGMDSKTLFLTGDVMYDAILFYQEIAQTTAAMRTLLEEIPENFCLATVHRAENTDDPRRLDGIVTALERIARDQPVLLPLHPRTRRLLKTHGLSLTRVRAIEPIGYFDMLKLLERCALVLTDSGGLQKEAFFLRRPCVTLRDETEWIELVAGGYNVLAGADTERILHARATLATVAFDWSRALYGDGRAGEHIVRILTGAT
jgi:UDP-GlcNAc3NAcA epimerase